MTGKTINVKMDENSITVTISPSGARLNKK